MREFKSWGEALLYTWDYFYIANTPARGDEKAWATIERALCRVRESEYQSGETIPVDVRRPAVRRMRDGLRVAVRQTALLRVRPEAWVVAQLEALRLRFEVLHHQLASREVTVH